MMGEQDVGKDGGASLVTGQPFPGQPTKEHMLAWCQRRTERRTVQPRTGAGGQSGTGKRKRPGAGEEIGMEDLRGHKDQRRRYVWPLVTWTGLGGFGKSGSG